MRWFVFLEPVFTRNICGFSSIILLQTREKIRRRAVARQVFFTQYAAKFAEKTRVYACEDRFLMLFRGFQLPQIAAQEGVKATHCLLPSGVAVQL